MNKRQLYVFDGFRLDADNLVLLRDDKIVALKPKALEILRSLVRRRGEMATKDELISEVWPDTFVEENSLSRNIHEIRKALGEYEDFEFIETLTRRGYRFTREVILRDKSAAGFISEDQPGETRQRPPQKAEPLETDRKPRIRWHFLGIGLLAVLLFSSFIFWRGINGESELSGVPRNKRNIKSLAILPLNSLDEHTESKVLSLGLSDELISNIAEFNLFVVRPLSAVRKYGDSELNGIEIGKELRVDAILVGTFQQSNDKLRVNLRLWDVRDGAQLWTNSFEEVETDLFKLQEALALQVADNLLSELSEDETRVLKTRPTMNREAYRHYLRGRYAWDKRTKNSLRESESFYKKAIELDPSFGLAYAGLADSYVIYNDYGVAPPAESFAKARAAAKKALEIDPDSVEPRATLAYILASYDWEYAKAEDEYRMVIKRKPNYATAHQWYAEMLMATARFDEALVEYEKAKSLNPLVPIIRSEIGVTKFYMGNYDEAAADFEKLKNEFPGFPTSYVFLARTYEQQGHFEKSVPEELKYLELLGLSPQRLALLNDALSRGGRTAYLQTLAAGFESDAKKEYVYEYRLVHFYARLRNRGKLIEWLEKGVKNRSSNIGKVYIDPNFAFIKDDPDFQRLLRKMNLPNR